MPKATTVAPDGATISIRYTGTPPSHEMMAAAVTHHMNSRKAAPFLSSSSTDPDGDPADHPNTPQTYQTVQSLFPGAFAPPPAPSRRMPPAPRAVRNPPTQGRAIPMSYAPAPVHPPSVVAHPAFVSHTPPSTHAPARPLSRMDWLKQSLTSHAMGQDILAFAHGVYDQKNNFESALFAPILQRIVPDAQSKRQLGEIAHQSQGQIVSGIQHTTAGDLAAAAGYEAGDQRDMAVQRVKKIGSNYLDEATHHPLFFIANTIAATDGVKLTLSMSATRLMGASNAFTRTATAAEAAGDTTTATAYRLAAQRATAAAQKMNRGAEILHRSQTAGPVGDYVRQTVAGAAESALPGSKLAQRLRHGADFHTVAGQRLRARSMNIRAAKAAQSRRVPPQAGDVSVKDVPAGRNASVPAQAKPPVLTSQAYGSPAKRLLPQSNMGQRVLPQSNMGQRLLSQGNQGQRLLPAGQAPSNTGGANLSIVRRPFTAIHSRTLTKYASSLINSGVDEFDPWATDMVQTFGAGVLPHLTTLFKGTQDVAGQVNARGKPLKPTLYTWQKHMDGNGTVGYRPPGGTLIPAQPRIWYSQPGADQMADWQHLKDIGATLIPLQYDRTRVGWYIPRDPSSRIKIYLNGGAHYGISPGREGKVAAASGSSVIGALNAIANRVPNPHFAMALGAQEMSLSNREYANVYNAELQHSITTGEVNPVKLDEMVRTFAQEHLHPSRGPINSWKDYFNLVMDDNSSLTYGERRAMMENLGSPAVAATGASIPYHEVLNGFNDYHGVPQNHIVAIAKVHPGQGKALTADDLRVPPHPSYKYVSAGKWLGVTYPIYAHDIFGPAWERTLPDYRANNYHYHAMSHPEEGQTRVDQGILDTVRRHEQAQGLYDPTGIRAARRKKI